MTDEKRRELTAKRARYVARSKFVKEFKVKSRIEEVFDFPMSGGPLGPARYQATAYLSTLTTDDEWQSRCTLFSGPMRKTKEQAEADLQAVVVEAETIMAMV